jgi:hypothetical protein
MFFVVILFQQIIRTNDDETFTNLRQFFFYGVLLASWKFFVYGDKIVLRFLLVLVFTVIIRINEDEQIEN